MDICLPSAETTREPRHAALEADRLIWRIDPTQRGLPLAGKVITASYSPAWMKQAGEMRVQLVAARTKAKADPKLPPGREPGKGSSTDVAAMATVTSTEQYDALYFGLPTPTCKKHQGDDGYFAWERLAGCNPGHLRQQTASDPRFPVTQAHFAAAVSDNDSLDQARAEGRIFVVDHSALQDIPTGETKGFKRYCVGAMGLFVRRLGGHFAPVAVQSGASPDAGISTPRDGLRWTDAKLSLQVADAIWSGSVMHLGACHSLSGGVQVCTARELAPNHPLRVLLWPHFDMNAAANETMKDLVIGKDGYFDELMAPTLEAAIDLAVRQLRTHSLRDKSLPRDLALRGCADTKALPTYPYRDDGLPVFEALHRWVSGYLHVYYKDDATVATDPELAGWLRALSASDGAGFPGVPQGATLDELSDLVTTILFQITGLHATVNYNGYDHFAWPTNYPTSRWAPPLAPTVEGTEADLLRALPPLRVADRMLDLMLPQLELRMNTLGDYPEMYFGDPKAFAHLTAFKSELKMIEGATVLRNITRPWSYESLLPTRIAQSIHV